MPRKIAKTAERPAEAGFLVLRGRAVPYTVEWSSKRRRSYGFVVDKAGVVAFRAPRWVRVAELLEFAERRERFIFNRLAELRESQEAAMAKLEMADKWCELPDIWFKKAAKRVMPGRVQYWAKRVGVTVGTIRMTSGRTVWGSCNSKGNISLSWRLMRVPAGLREYVILHEVCHRKQMNHGPKFWALVGQYVPDYVEKRRTLAKMGAELG